MSPLIIKLFTALSLLKTCHGKSPINMGFHEETLAICEPAFDGFAFCELRFSVILVLRPAQTQRQAPSASHGLHSVGLGAEIKVQRPTSFFSFKIRNPAHRGTRAITMPMVLTKREQLWAGFSVAFQAKDEMELSPEAGTSGRLRMGNQETKPAGPSNSPSIFYSCHTRDPKALHLRWSK